jgi:hypothetical protein
MSQEILLRKRAAKAGEIGLFLETPVFEEEWNAIPRDVDVRAELSVPSTLKYMRFFRALCGLLAQNCDWLNGDPEFAKEQLLLECRHATYHHDKLRNKTEVRAKTTKNLSADQWIRLLGRARFAVEQKFLPGTPHSAIKNEIIKMIKDRR